MKGDEPSAVSINPVLSYRRMHFSFNSKLNHRCPSQNTYKTQNYSKRCKCLLLFSICHITILRQCSDKVFFTKASLSCPLLHISYCKTVVRVSLLASSQLRPSPSLPSTSQLQKPKATAPLCPPPQNVVRSAERKEVQALGDQSIL